MATADWRDKVTPTAEDVAQAFARDHGEGILAALFRTANAAVFTLADNGVSLEVTRGSMTDGQYMNVLWPAALVVTKKHQPGSIAHTAAELLGLICTLFQHWTDAADDPARPAVDMKGYGLCLAIGHRAGVLMLDEVGLFDVATKAEAAKKGRGDAVRDRNAAKTAWHDGALKLALRHRETYPHRATAQIASVIDNDPSIYSPSPTQVLDTLRAWEKDGTLPRRKRADQK